jgi:hypothetical protein
MGLYGCRATTDSLVQFLKVFVMLKSRAIGPFTVNPLGLGCMNLSHGYGPPVDRVKAQSLVLRHWIMGLIFLTPPLCMAMARMKV